MPIPLRDEQRRSFDITIAGETNLDLILYGLPEKGPSKESFWAPDSRYPGGSFSILAHNLAALGSRVGFISQVGRDEMGKIALARLKYVLGFLPCGFDVFAIHIHPCSSICGIPSGGSLLQ